VASINGMLVKEYLQALSDDGKIHVEKIGSGNWYWSFMSEERKSRESVMDGLKKEHERVDAAVTEMEEKVREATGSRGEEEDRGKLIEMHFALEQEVGELRQELAGYKNNDPGEVDGKRKEVEGFEAMADMWTDNIGILESRLKEMLGGDLAQLEGIKRSVYGEEYMEGEGLREL